MPPVSSLEILSLYKAEFSKGSRIPDNLDPSGHQAGRRLGEGISEPYEQVSLGPSQEEMKPRREAA